MTDIRWIDGAAPGAGVPAGAVAWLFEDDHPATAAVAGRAGVGPDDLADAALARAGGGAPRLLRRRVLRALASQLFGAHPMAFAFRRDVRGAVRLAGPVDGFVSTAGRCGWSAVILGLAPVGVDVEGAEALPAAALHAWLAEEAWSKALGLGLGEPRMPVEGAPVFLARGPVVACALSLAEDRVAVQRRPTRATKPVTASATPGASGVEGSA